MENTARLALIEQSLREPKEFKTILKFLIQFIDMILSFPDSAKKICLHEDLKRNLRHTAFADYLKYIGFHLTDDEIYLGRESGLTRLEEAKKALERKLYMCSGSDPSHLPENCLLEKPKNYVDLQHLQVLKTNNPLLMSMQSSFNHVLIYENRYLQMRARQCVPRLQLERDAVDHVRKHQVVLKNGEIDYDLSYEMAFLIELVMWFKHKFFTWVDQPPCSSCGHETRFSRAIKALRENEHCNVELYKCVRCDAVTEFPRYNNPGQLLRSRRGRCGEWANCFALICRSFKYDVRYVVDTSDHVWCEVFDFSTFKWIHVDPCEAKINTPLMYSHGWKKKLSYVMAYSYDDVQDVTWRYTTQHKEVLKRRNICKEMDLVDCIMVLREARQRPLGVARKKFLAKIAVMELADLMVEKAPSQYESYGRISGSKEWRSARGEIGTNVEGYTFQFNTAGLYRVTYSTATDKYKVLLDNREISQLEQWSAGVYNSNSIFKKVEHDWKMSYLAREEGAIEGNVTWRFHTSASDLKFKAIKLKANTKVYENGKIVWTLQLNKDKPITINVQDEPTIRGSFRSATLTATLSGGLGVEYWQHAQLFRQPLDSNDEAPLYIELMLATLDDVPS